MLKVILLLASVCPFSGFAQAARSSSSTSTALLELLRAVAAYPRDDHQIRRTLALVVASTMRLEDLQRAGSVEAGSFEARLAKQIRMARATLNLLGTNSLEDVRRDLAKNLQQSSGGMPVDQFLGAVADREVRLGKSEPYIRRTVAAVVQTLMKDVQGPARQSAVANLITEAGAVVRVFGDDQLALEAICDDLGLIREENRTPATRGQG